MRCVRIVLVVSFALLVLAVRAQQSSIPSLDASIQRDHDLHVRALRAVKAEQVRAGQPLGPKGISTVGINACDAHKLSIEEANYLALARALGALLRSGDDAASLRKPVAIPFDQAETT